MPHKVLWTYFWGFPSPRKLVSIKTLQLVVSEKTRAAGFLKEDKGAAPFDPLPRDSRLPLP